MVLYARLPTNKRTANQLSPKWKRGRDANRWQGHTRRQQESVENLTRCSAMVQAAIVARIGGFMGRRRLACRGVATLGAVCVASAVLTGAGGLPAIKRSDLKEWLSYIASDELQGRAVYTAGIGLAAAYIEDHGLDAPAANHMDFRGRNVKGAVVVWLGAAGPKGLDPNASTRRSLRA